MKTRCSAGPPQARPIAGELDTPGWITLVEVLQPKVSAGLSIIIGNNAPLPPGPPVSGGDTGPADLIVLWPSPAECRTPGWLPQAVWLLAQHLAPEGMAYVLVPAPWRLGVVRRLRSYGLGASRAVVHLPDSAATRYLVPLKAKLLAYTCSTLVDAPSWRLRVLALMLHCPGSADLLALVLPHTGLIVRRAAPPPLLQWLLHMPPAGHLSGDAILQVTARRPAQSVIIHGFARGGRSPAIIAKVVPAGMEGSNRPGEDAALAELGPAARVAGVAVPQPLLCAMVAGRRVLLQTAVPGRSLAPLLVAHPARFPDYTARVVAWLAQWNRRTLVIQPRSREQLERDVVAPASLLGPLLDSGGAYINWLRRICAAAAGPMPLAAAHNDLTMWNILIDKRGCLGVLDWESARPTDLPLKDFFYALVDAVAATGGYTDRLAAFQQCFAHNGTYRPWLNELQARFPYTRDIPAPVLDLCFHACWIQHAVNEQRSAAPHEQRPFLRIVQWLASHTSTVGGRFEL